MAESSGFQHSSPLRVALGDPFAAIFSAKAILGLKADPKNTKDICIIRRMESVKMKLREVSEYLSQYRKLKAQISRKEISFPHQLKFALLANFTTNGMAETLTVQCAEAHIQTEVFVADYNQYHSEILNGQSELWNFRPDVTVLFIDLETLCGQRSLDPYSQSTTERRQWVEDHFLETQQLVEAFKKNCKGKLILHNFAVPIYSPFGILEQKQEFGFSEAISTLNAKIREAYRKDSQIFVFDYDQFCSSIGKAQIIDQKFYYLGDLRLALRHFPALANEYLSIIKPLCAQIKKCLVLDLDNTLWGGVIGEDGLAKIRLGPTPEGRPFMEFQQGLRALQRRGLILAINSKNNQADVDEVFEKHPYMVLRKEDFAATRINWTDKVTNMRELAQELNIGLDSFVFFDDDDLNCEMVRTSLPEVHTVQMPEDSSLHVGVLKDLKELSVLQLTAEDAKKSLLYADQKRREQLKGTASDITEYLRALGTKLTLEGATSFNIPRLAQMTQKTNQFNMTTHRYQEEDIQNFAASTSHMVIAANVADKFGDNGLTGLAIVCKDESRWTIDSFLLSCRVIGRKVEESIFEFILERARAAGARTIVGEFKPTAKNEPAKKFYRECGFELVEKNGDIETWEYPVEKNFPHAQFIEVAINFKGEI
jgi:FkbH-like protein